MKFSVLSYRGSGESEGHDQKNEARHFQPQLMQSSSKGPGRGADGIHGRAEGATAPRLIPGHARDHTGLS